MVRWRYSVVLAMLLLLPAKNGLQLEDEEESEENEEDDDDDEGEEEDEPVAVADKGERVTVVRRPSPIVPTPKPMTVSGTIKKRPPECYVCYAFMVETPLIACLDPIKFRVHNITCDSAEDNCFTSVISKGSSYEAVVRGCRSGCVESPETTCCELDRCNNQTLAMPVIAPHSLTTSNKSRNIEECYKFCSTI